MAAVNRQTEDAEEQIRALGHPLRVEIMREYLSPENDAPLSPREVASKLAAPLSNVSYHVRQLAFCNAIHLVRTKPVRGSMQHFYRPTKKFRTSPLVAFVLGAGEAATAA